VKPTRNIRDCWEKNIDSESKIKKPTENEFGRLLSSFDANLAVGLLDRDFTTLDFDGFAARQGLTIAVWKGNEATAVAELNGLSRANLQFGLARTLGDDKRLGAGFIILDAGSKCRTRRDRTEKNSNSKLLHFLPGVSTAPDVKSPTPFSVTVIAGSN
jgi:hypothetical protein